MYIFALTSTVYAIIYIGKAEGKEGSLRAAGRKLVRKAMVLRTSKKPRKTCPLRPLSGLWTGLKSDDIHEDIRAGIEHTR
jgi:hypothetical protein